MRTDNRRIALATWRRAALVSTLLFFSLCWILVDSLLSLTAKEHWTEIAIPDLCGMQESEIERHPHLSLRTEYRYDDTAARGTVIAQSPRAGTKRRLYDGQSTVELRLTVSLGKLSRELPDTEGQDAREAEAALRALGLAVEIRTVPRRTHAGRVLSQSPQAGTALTEGETVTLWVGVGEAPKVSVVPTLIGLTRAQALLELASSGLSLGELREADGVAGESETVVAQSHPSGTSVLAGTKISITMGRVEEAYVFGKGKDHVQ